MHQPFVHETKDGTVLSVHIQPNASRTECVGLHGEALKIRVAAPPVDGSANEEVIRFLARTLTIPVSAVSIESGLSGRRKRILLKGVTSDSAASRLHAAISTRGAR